MGRTTKSQLPEQAPSDPANRLKQILLVPWVIFFWLSGKTTVPFLAEMSGLSKSLLRRRRLRNLKESTKQSAIASADKFFLDKTAKQKWNKEDATVSGFQQAAPSILAGEPRPYADFIYLQGTPDSPRLPLTVAFAEEIDKLLNRMLAAIHRNDLELFKRDFVNFDWGNAYPRSDVDRHDADCRMDAFRAAQSLDAALTFADPFVWDLLVSLFAALDAEHCSTYFVKFRPRPLLLLITPKLNVKVDLNAQSQEFPRRDFADLPVRRLLEFSHAIVFWVKEKRWPDKPVGRKKLGEALGYGDQVIGNLFDGTKNMNATSYDRIWRYMWTKVAKCESPYFSWPLLLATIVCQKLLITRDPNQKLKSFVLIGHEDYTRLWNWHRQRWASQLSEGTEDWPAWL